MVEIKPQVVEVVVIPDRVQVTPRGALGAEPGPVEIVYPDLPLGLEPDSLRASGCDTAEAALLGVDVRRQDQAAAPPELVALRSAVERDQELADDEEMAEARLV